MGTIDILSNNTEKRLTMQQTKEESPSVLLFTQLRPTLCDPVSSSHKAPVCGSLQAEYWSEWAAAPSSRGSPQPRDRTQVCHIAGGFFLPSEPPVKTQRSHRHPYCSQQLISRKVLHVWVSNKQVMISIN